MRNKVWSIVFPAILILLLQSSLMGRETTRPEKTSCDETTLREAKAEFKRLRSKFQNEASAVPEDEFRLAANLYIYEAERCYQALYGVEAVSGQPIDDGGVWMDGQSPSIRAAVAPDGDWEFPQHVLFGTKWGAGSPFVSGTDIAGPRVAGGTVTYSFMAGGIDLSGDCGAGCTNTGIFAAPGSGPCWLTEITDAFGAWSAVADIDFIPVTDAGGAFNVGATGDIRIGWHPFDGVSGILAHGFFPPPNGATAAGDVHFDVGESWQCDPAFGSLVGTSSFDIGIVALHEFGHAIGLSHEVTDVAVMEGGYNSALTFGPLADDIIGAGEIYGGSPVGKSFFFGDVGIGLDDPIASLHILRDDGSARIRVEEVDPSRADRNLIVLRNNGPTSFSIRNTGIGNNWNFTAGSLDNFQISKVGSGVLEFSLAAGGDATFHGDVTANGILLTSDMNQKDNIASINRSETLDKIAELPIASWTLKNRPGIRHVGPMAQDFYATFGLGKDDRHISPMDMSGVALAAIQGLHGQHETDNAQLRQGIRAKETELARQQQEIEDLKARLAAIERLLQASALETGRGQR